MALTIATHTGRSLSLEEYLEHIEHNVDPLDLDSVVASAEALKALANNPRFITDKLNRELADWKNFQSANEYTAQTLLLGGGKDWFVRANMWAPPSNVPEVTEWQKQLYFYMRPHDHNFTFLTVGYYGPGYETTLYECDPEQMVGYPGEPVELRFLERTTLPKGKVMLYRASRDVHSQEHPTAFSISLNLMLSGPAMHQTNQYYFDVDQGRVGQHVQNGSAGRVMICKVAKHLGDARTASLLDELSQKHPSARVRQTSYESLTVLEPGGAAQLWERALTDSDAAVRRAATRALAG